MTREMNKPDWHCKWIKTECYYGTLYEFKKEKPSNSRELNPDVAEFVESLNRSLSECGKQ